MKKNSIQSFWYDTVDSTMDEAKRLIQSGKINNIAFIAANHQTSGRGTHGRHWSSPPGTGIYLSVVHLPEEKKYLEITTLYTQAAGIACVEAIRDVCKLKTFLKPVNDIYVNGCKLGGILVESKLSWNGISSLITGIGININKTSHVLDRDIVKPISLEEVLAKDNFKNFSQEALVESIVSKVVYWYEVIFNEEYSTIQSLWNNYTLAI